MYLKKSQNTADASSVSISDDSNNPPLFFPLAPRELVSKSDLENIGTLNAVSEPTCQQTEVQNLTMFSL